MNKGTFGFFVSGNFMGIWGNKPGDEFFQLTCDGMNWAAENTSLVWYPNLQEIDGQVYEYSVESCVIKDLEDNILNTIEAVVYVNNGNMLIDC